MDRAIVRDTIEGSTMTIEHTMQGYIVITDIIDDQYITRKYMDYSTDEAKEIFRNEFNLANDYEG